MHQEQSHHAQMAAPHSPPESPPADSQSLNTPYSADFSNALIDISLENPNKKPSTKASGRAALEAATGDPDLRENTQFPVVEEGELPIALNDERRKFESHVPGVMLTHPGGAIAGGSIPSLPAILPADTQGSTQELDRRVRQLLQRQNLRTATQLRKYINSETQRQNDELKRRMRARKEALEQNEKIDKEIQQLEATRAMERRVEESMMEATKRRRESQES